MINVILLLIIFVCLNKWFYHTIKVLALWWQVLNNLYLQPYSFTGVCALLIAICFISKISKKEILWNSFPLRKSFLALFICYLILLFFGLNQLTLEIILLNREKNIFDLVCIDVNRLWYGVLLMELYVGLLHCYCYY